MNNMFDKTKINQLDLDNRFVRSGTWMRLASETGELTEELLTKYTELAKANLGMVICGYARIDEDERANDRMIGMYDDQVATTYQQLTEVFKANNTPLGIQLAVGGTQIHTAPSTPINWKVMSPSTVEMKRKDGYGNEMIYQVPEMRKEEIDAVIEQFVSAAVRVKNAGFDLVQLHAGHGYFLGQWMNPYINVREDEYGQDRGLFVKELYQAVREAVGEEMAIAIKLNSEEKIADHSNHEAMLKLCTELDQLGIDLIEVSGCAPSRMKVTADNESYFKDFATKLASSVNCKTMLTGGNKTFNNFANLLAETEVDYIGLSRPLISEPDLITKWQENPEYKMRCISCNHCHRKIYTCVFDK